MLRRTKTTTKKPQRLDKRVFLKGREILPHTLLERVSMVENKKKTPIGRTTHTIRNVCVGYLPIGMQQYLQQRPGPGPVQPEVLLIRDNAPFHTPSSFPCGVPIAIALFTHSNTSLLLSPILFAARLKRKSLTHAEIQQLKDYTPPLKHGSSQLFRSLRDKGRYSRSVSTNSLNSREPRANVD